MTSCGYYKWLIVLAIIVANTRLLSALLSHLAPYLKPRRINYVAMLTCRKNTKTGHFKNTVIVLK